jgi:hypothetical protein
MESPGRMAVGVITLMCQNTFGRSWLLDRSDFLVLTRAHLDTLHHHQSGLLDDDLRADFTFELVR